MKTTRHLKHEQLCDLMLAPSESASRTLEAAREHLRDCPACSAELEHLRESIALFRQAASSYAGQVYSRPLIHRSSLAPSPVYRSHVLYWAMAAMLAIAVALPFSLHRQHAPAPQPSAVVTAHTHNAESDEALLNGIDQELSADVPTAMQPLADPTGTASSQLTSAQRKN